MSDLLKKEEKKVFSELFGSIRKLPDIKETAEEKKERINDDFAFKLKKL